MKTALHFKDTWRPILVLVISVLVVMIILATSHLWHRPQKYKLVNACDVITQQIADSIIGNDDTKLQEVIATDNNNDTYATQCQYLPGRNSKSTYEVSLALRSARTPVGEEVNQSHFLYIPASSTRISGLGDNAYWIPNLGSLFMLKGNNWYTFHVGQINGPRSMQYSVDFARKVTARY